MTALIAIKGGTVMGFGYRVAGLVLNLIGSILIGVAGYEGLVTGYGSSANAWTSSAWEAAWKVGWALFIFGFPVQIVGECLGRRRRQEVDRRGS